MPKRRRRQSDPSAAAAPPARKAKSKEAAAAATPPINTDNLDSAFRIPINDDLDSASQLLLAEEMRRMREDFELQMHDRKVASEISAIPEHEWDATGGDYQRPYTKVVEGSTSAAATGGGELGFMLYSKGLVVEDKRKGKLGAIGVAILDSMNVVVFEVSKPLDLPKAEMEEVVAELEAFVDGLEFALNLDLKRVSYFSGDFNFDQFLNENRKPKEAKLAELVHRAIFLKKRFQICELSDATIHGAKIALDLARSSIVKQAGKSIEEVFPTKENCIICLEDVDSPKIIEIGPCQHRFCASCTRKHVELKVNGRELPRCPHPNCGKRLDIDTCKQLLPAEMHDVIDQIVLESSIPARQKVYCPDPKCSYLMLKSRVSASQMHCLANAAGKEVVLKKSLCVKCHKHFCLECRVLWNRHSDMTCDAYKNRKTNRSSDDDMLKELAGSKKWRQCPMCSHMVELALGCNHIYCRCGHEFCYVCGCKWMNKRPTCSCPLWAEENIILHGGVNAQ